MRRRTMVLLICVLLPQSAWAITWGEVDAGNEFPHVGAMMWSIPSTGGVIPLCSGVLVHPRLFLTAAHCIVLSQFQLGTGFIDDVVVSFDLDVGTSPTVRRVSEMVASPLYNELTLKHDFGILVLEDPVDDITPAALPSQNFLNELDSQHALKQGQERVQYLVTGYGRTLTWAPPTTHRNNLRQFVRSEHSGVLKQWLRTSQNNAATDGGGTCAGDSGGPVFYENPDGSLVIVGVTSWGDSVCVGVGFYSRVDIPESLNLIDQVLDGLE